MYPHILYFVIGICTCRRVYPQLPLLYIYVPILKHCSMCTYYIILYMYVHISTYSRYHILHTCTSMCTYVFQAPYCIF